MTKDQFENYNGEIYCKKCEHVVPKRKVYYANLYQDGTLSHCNVCDWIKRHGGIPKIDGIDDKQMIDLLHYFINDEDPKINYLVEQYGISLDEAILIYD